MTKEVKCDICGETLTTAWAAHCCVWDDSPPKIYAWATHHTGKVHGKEPKEGFNLK